jgi:CDP-paratose 2-epimerase
VLEKIDLAKGHIFNIGGGPRFALAIHEVFPLLEKLLGKKIPLTYGDWRPGDQPVYISDIAKAHRLLTWQPTTAPEDGIAAVVKWSKENADLLRSLALDTSALQKARVRA